MRCSLRDEASSGSEFGLDLCLICFRADHILPVVKRWQKTVCPNALPLDVGQQQIWLAQLSEAYCPRIWMIPSQTDFQGKLGVRKSVKLTARCWLCVMADLREADCKHSESDGISVCAGSRRDSVIVAASSVASVSPFSDAYSALEHNRLTADCA